MKLTAEQIEYVENYIISKDIKYYELQIELTDHMITSMEEFWKKDPELTFHQVKYYAEDKFGKNGFKAIEEERTQILRKEFKRAQLKMVAEYFKSKNYFSYSVSLFSFKASFILSKVKFVKIYFFTSNTFYPALYSFFTNRNY
jgi:hypothetical protein